MKKTNYTINVKMMPVNQLKQAAMLKRYGIDKPSEFEIDQLGRFGLTEHLKGVVITATGVVLCNWEFVQVAKAAKIKEIEVTTIENLLDDEIPQVVSLMNVRKRLTKKALANLIIDYRDYLTKNETGITWACDVPGDSTDAKIGKLIGYSYGMVNGYQKIYKYHPEFLGMIDKDEMSYTEALKAIKEENNPPSLPCETPGNDVPPAPTASKAPKNNYAGERNMVECEAMESIQIRYASGKTVDVIIEGSAALCQLFGKEIEVAYTSRKEAFEGGAEFHRLDAAGNLYNIELVIRKAA
ncbi:hypothetical protein CJD36_016815 [Flavipsychrobacter stenotrophus]|uniref:Uncharacterized protein n=1 Tax=Flavipsychrobacter stenotrophus TaxID=2077091 RepID=A0A2S7SSI8_9BACT|nr:hypothetical protein [Flavipsychrobacter stenotrophus]PQJ09601.1 hypothetical protein CJD36_016815 [Flavipsychrobacter stenotrophus]